LYAERRRKIHDLLPSVFLDTDDHVIMGEDVEAPELSSAIDAARRLSVRYPGAHPDRFEVWMGTHRVFRRLDPAASSFSSIPN
jgi:hypothetical protein